MIFLLFVQTSDSCCVFGVEADIYSKLLKLEKKNVVDEKEKLHNDVETMTGFSYLGDRINSGGGCEMAVTSRIR